MKIGEQLRKSRVKFHRGDFRFIESCPVCTQDKPVEDFTIKEWLHIRNHLASIAHRMIRGDDMI